LTVSYLFFCYNNTALLKVCGAGLKGKQVQWDTGREFMWN